MDRTTLCQQLAVLRPTLHALGTPYCLIGSAAMMLHGAALATCDDIDILTTKHGAQQLERLWHSQWQASEHAQGHRLFRSHYGRYRFAHGTVEVMGALELERQGSWEPVTVQDVITIEGITVASIPELRRLLTRFGRPKDHEKLSLLG